MNLSGEPSPPSSPRSANATHDDARDALRAWQLARRMFAEEADRRCHRVVALVITTTVLAAVVGAATLALDDPPAAAEASFFVAPGGYVIMMLAVPNFLQRRTAWRRLVDRLPLPDPDHPDAADTSTDAGGADDVMADVAAAIRIGTVGALNMRKRHDVLLAVIVIGGISALIPWTVGLIALVGHLLG